MGIAEHLSSIDAHSGVSKEFRVYTVHGAVLSVATIVGEKRGVSVDDIVVMNQWRVGTRL
jgi:hypothetical protein